MDTRENVGGVSGAARADAFRFFLSMKPDYVYWRHLWFDLAGVPEPEPTKAALVIRWLCSRRQRG